MNNLDVNVCKNDRCKNLGISQSPDYELHPHALNAPSLFCKACNALQAPIQSNEDLHALLSPALEQFHRSTLLACPSCQGSLRRYGHTRAGSARYQCSDCQTVFSPPRLREREQTQLSELAQLLFEGESFTQIQRQLGLAATSFYRRLSRLADVLDHQVWRLEQQCQHRPSRLATSTRVIPLPRAQAGLSDLALWALISADADSGYVWAQTHNFTQQTVSPMSRFHGGDVHGPVVGTTLTQRLESVTEQFWCRLHFEDLVYMPTSSDRLRKGTVLMPIVTAHLHFQWLRHMPALQQIHHYLSYELISRSACVTAYHEQIKTGTSDVFYVMETLGQPASGSTEISEISRFSWWNNYWQHLVRDNGEERMLALLSEHDNWQQQFQQHQDASLKTSRRFEHFLNKSALAKRQNELKPANYLLMARIFRHIYNFTQQDSEQQTPAMRAGLAQEPISVAQLLAL